MISLSRRLEILSKNRLAEVVDFADGIKVYSLPGSREGVGSVSTPQMKITQSAIGEKIYNLIGGEPGVENE